MEVPVTPTSVEQFTPEWVSFIIKDWFRKNEKEPENVKILEIVASLNTLQGLLSTTYIVDVKYEYKGEKEDKSLFVKIPITGDLAKNFKQVNEREKEMLETVLPKLKEFMDEKCSGFFQLPIPEIIYSHYSGDEVHDAFVIENLVAAGYISFTNSTGFTEDYLRSVLGCLAQLHGTGLALKKSLGGNAELVKTFPKMEQQLQIRDIIENKESRKLLRKHFIPFLHYLEITDEGLKNHTGYLKKMHKHIFKILKVLQESGSENLVTLCHGDAKTNNFMFRKIEIDLEDLECEGIEGMLIDWQGGYLGSVSNDLMWSIYPFVESSKDNKTLFSMAINHYFEELKAVLESFDSTLEDFELKDDLEEFEKNIKRGMVLEFLNVTVISPILNIQKPELVRRWFRRLEIHEAKVANAEESKPPRFPPLEEVCQNQRFMEFVNLYFKIATSLGAFQELAQVYFTVMRDAMFGDDKDKVDLFDDGEDVESILPDENEGIFARIKKSIISLFSCTCCSKNKE